MSTKRTPRIGATGHVSELGDLELDDVSYTYDGDGQPVLRGIELRIGHGETLGIVGPSGSGKSTLAQILLGLREPTDGRYSAGGMPAMDIAQEDWFRLVTVVPQQPRLLRASVLDNIVFYRPWISAEAAQRAAVAAGLHDEIVAAARPATTRRSAMPSGTCPAGSVNGWALPGRSRATRNCSCSTNRPVRSTRCPRRVSRRR